jgi:hypothetical protein
VVAAVIGLVTALAQIGNRAREEAEAAAAMPACMPEATRYGTEPKGFTYTPLKGAVRRERIGGRDAAWVKNEDGTRIATAIKGCHLVLVLAETDALLRRVSAAVFRP